MKDTEFAFLQMPRRRRGLTSIEAVQFVRREFPEVAVWTCWRTATQPYGIALSMLCGEGYSTEGEVANWRWRRVKCSYPELAYYSGRHYARLTGREWVGVLEVLGPGGERFLLFSYLSASGEVGASMLASTTDVALLERFGREVAAAYAARDGSIRINVCNGMDIWIPEKDDMPLFLPEAMLSDIESQVQTFFENREVFRRLQLRHRRGLLFAGAPGNGKTMMVRHLIRLAHRRYSAQLFSVVVRSNTDQDDIEHMFSLAAEKGPSVIILEDIDSLVRETAVTRAALLNLLDGLDPREGALVLATTNNPEDLDPALTQRPSRFDRVWRFGLPDAELRQKYLDWAFPTVGEGVRTRLASGTSGWSFAFLNELRVSVALLALRSGRTEVGELDLLAAHELLAAQLKAGKKGFCDPAEEGKLGFGS
jgi:hypothetical protein